MLAALAAISARPAQAQTVFHYTVSASTFPVDNTVDEANPVAAQISNSVAVEQIWISASSTATAQTVSIYSHCTSSDAVTLVWRGYIAAASVAIPTFHLQYPLAPARFYLTNACFRKSDTGSDVQFTVKYQ